MLFIRILNPDVWHTVYGGEKTMEVGFLNSALRSPWMPPADPFFSGGYVNYYYQGQFLIACLIKLVGVDPAIAYNLSFPLLFGLCFTAAASIVYNIVAWSRRLAWFRPRSLPGRHGVRRACGRALPVHRKYAQPFRVGADNLPA